MSHRKILIKAPEACTGCSICEMVCSLTHEKSGINPRMSRIRILNFPEKGVIIPMVCRLCMNPPCAAACPIKALSQNVKTGVITVDDDKCVGCGRCMEACPFGCITIHPTKRTAMVCDLCGGEPLCVKYCANETLLFLKPEEYVVARGKGLIDKTVPSIWPEPRKHDYP
jgi:Fe-S-cluster-containing hydrogenase component 2